jgi:hypothetical protein
MTLFLLSLTVIAIAMLIMAVGVIFSGRCLHGSCGGPEVLTSGGESLSCAACPRRKERERKRQEEQAESLLPTLQ